MPGAVLSGDKSNPMEIQINIIGVQEVIGSAGSIRKTIHLFLPDGKIQHSEESIPQAIRGVSHRMITEKENGLPTAFMGIEGGTLAMLFIALEERELGKLLIQCGIKHYPFKKATANDKNRR